MTRHSTPNKAPGLRSEFYSYLKKRRPFSRVAFKRKWRALGLFTTIMVLTPLFTLMFIDAKLSIQTLKNQTAQGMALFVEAYAQYLAVSLQKAGKTKDSPLPHNSKEIQRLLEQNTSNAHLDLFVIDQTGQMVTPSSLFGTETGRLKTLKSVNGREPHANPDVLFPGVIVASAKVNGSPYTLVAGKKEQTISDLYFHPRIKLIGYLVTGVLLVLVSIFGSAAYLWRRIEQADKKRIDSLHRAESANKLAAIGRLASGVAHEINNPLAIINEKNGLIMDILTASSGMESRQKLLSLAGDVTKAVRRCGRITRRLLDFARHLEPSIEQVNIEQIISQLLTFYEKEAERYGIEIRLDFSGQIPEFESDKGSLQQIFLNLVENAFDAMKSGGLLTISGHHEGNSLTITVSDTGTGIARENRHKIFEPFYTSKSDMWKTGLGLSITYGLIKEINGDITLKSEPGKGSQFILTLPVKPMPKQQESLV